MAFKYSLPLKGKNKLLVFEKSFTINDAGPECTFQDDVFNSDIIKTATYAKICKLMNTMYERGYYDAQKDIRKKLKEFKYSMGYKHGQ